MLTNKRRIFEVVIAGRSFYVSDMWAEALTRVVELAATSKDGLYAPVRLVHCGPKKIAVIKEVRSLMGLSLKEAKYLCDDVQDGQTKELGIFPWHEVPQIIARFQECGARAEAPSALEMLAREAE
jgi:ribosomal protein L7/L12